jgi:hypothetical protein
MAPSRLIGARQAQVKKSLPPGGIDAAAFAQEKALRKIVGALNCHHFMSGFSSSPAAGA